MLRSLGVYAVLKWFLVAVVAVAVWQGFNGNLAAIGSAVWGWVLMGADLVTRVWVSINR